MTIDYKQIGLQDIKLDLADNYADYEGHEKFECMKIDIENLVKAVEAYKEEVARLQADSI